VAIDDFPGSLASTRYFTLGVPALGDGLARWQAGAVSSALGAVKTRSRALWRLDLADGGGGREWLVADPAAPWNFGPGDVPEAEPRPAGNGHASSAAGIVAYSADANCRTVVFAPGRAAVGTARRRRPRTEPGRPSRNRCRAAGRGGRTRGSTRRGSVWPTSRTGRAARDRVVRRDEPPAGRPRARRDVSYGLAEHVAAESMLRFPRLLVGSRRPAAAGCPGRQFSRPSAGGSPTPPDPERPPAPRSGTRRPGTANAEVTLHVLRLDGSRNRGHLGARRLRVPGGPRSGTHEVRCSVCRAETSGRSWCWRPTAVTGQTNAPATPEHDDAWVEASARHPGADQFPGSWSPCPTGTAPGASWSAALPSRQTGLHVGFGKRKPTARRFTSRPPTKRDPHRVAPVAV